MPGTFLNFPFDEEIFLLNWQNAVDPTLTAMIDSGAVVQDGVIAGLIANGSNTYTIPFYDVLGGTPDNYDGDTDITVSSPTGGSQTGVVYGRAHAWKDHDFIHEFNSKANPTAAIANQVAKYWQKKRQARLIGLLGGIFSIADDSTDAWDAWQLHTLNIAAASGTVGDANKVSEATAAEAVQKAVGDNAGIFTMAIMHSKIALALAKLNLLQYRKYTDAAGIERTVNIADYNGMTVIVDDGVPVTASVGVSGAYEYTTYLFGAGAIRYAKAPVLKPVETDRVSLTDGGYDVLINRFRETLHPNGFNYTLPFVSGSSGPKVASPTDAQLAAYANWGLAGIDPKGIAIARVISNG